MKTIFDQSTRDELISRIHTLNDDSKAQWGDMTIHHMIQHCAMWEEVVQGHRKVKRTWMSRLIGKMFLKKILKDDGPLQRNLPAISELKVHVAINGDLTSRKQEWISLINAYPQLTDHRPELPFFGRVKKEQAGYMAYKHSDHHLRQFNA